MVDIVGAVVAVSNLVVSIDGAAGRARINQKLCAELSRKCDSVSRRLARGELEFATNSSLEELINAISNSNADLIKFSGRGFFKRLILSGEAEKILAIHFKNLDQWMAFGQERLSDEELNDERRRASRLRLRVSDRQREGVASLESESTGLATVNPILTEDLDVRQEIGRFPFGTIRAGTYKNKPVYIRVISDDVTGGQLDYILQSIHLGNCLVDCGVCRVIGVCEGRMIVTATTTHGPLSRLAITDGAKKVDIAYKIADALMGVHDVKNDTECVVHRDIRAENILINQGPDNDDELEPVITGFEMCKQNRSPTGEHPKIPEYYQKWWSPERILKLQSSPESDVFAFGVLMYEISTGSEPEAVGADLVMLERMRICKEYTALMKRCLNPGHNSRPTMETVARELSSIRNILLVTRNREQ